MAGELYSSWDLFNSKTPTTSTPPPPTQSNGGLIGSIISAVPSVIEQFNYKKQRTDLEIAQANALSAQAMASGSPEATKKNWIWIVAIVGVVVLLIFLISRKNG